MRSQSDGSCLTDLKEGYSIRVRATNLKRPLFETLNPKSGHSFFLRQIFKDPKGEHRVILGDSNTSREVARWSMSQVGDSLEIRQDCVQTKITRTDSRGFAVGTPKYGVFPYEGKRVALFQDVGVWSPSFEGLLDLLKNRHRMQVQIVDANDLRLGVLGQKDLLVVPGGNSWEYLASLGPQGREQVIEFVQKGGRYLGICAGAFTASRYRHGKPPTPDLAHQMPRASLATA